LLPRLFKGNLEFNKKFGKKLRGVNLGGWLAMRLRNCLPLRNIWDGSFGAIKPRLALPGVFVNVLREVGCLIGLGNDFSSYGCNLLTIQEYFVIS